RAFVRWDMGHHQRTLGVDPRSDDGGEAALREIEDPELRAYSKVIMLAEGRRKDYRELLAASGIIDRAKQDDLIPFVRHLNFDNLAEIVRELAPEQLLEFIDGVRRAISSDPEEDRRFIELFQDDPTRLVRRLLQVFFDYHRQKGELPPD